jgi:DNA-binding Lrp family transcriptional regulator
MTRQSDSDGTDSDAKRPAPLDELDLQILTILREQGRISVPQLAERVHVSRATAYARLHRLHELDVLRGYSAVVNPARVGTTVGALVLVTSAQRGHRRWTKWKEQLEAIEAVEYAAMVAGETDILLLLRVRDHEELRRVLLEEIQDIEYVGGTQTLLILDEIIHRPFVVPTART